MIKKIFYIVLPILIIPFVSSCSAISKKESPVIYFSNASEKPITNIQAIWAEDNVLTLNRLDPGDSRSQSFYIGSDSEFFGLVKISWTNGDGEGVSREFFFRKNNMPSINDDSTYNYVQIYLEQNNFEAMSSDAADLESKTARRDAMLSSYKNKYLHDQPVQVPSSLIRVAPIKDHSLPSWMNRAF